VQERQEIRTTIITPYVSQKYSEVSEEGQCPILPLLMALVFYRYNYYEKYSQTLAPFLTSSLHVPTAVSPQLCVVMNAQLLKPSEDVSRTRRASRVDRVP